jgi:hypothetical protein
VITTTARNRAGLAKTAVRTAEQAERAEGGVHQLPHVVGADQAPRRRADALGNLRDRGPTVDGEHHLVQERRQRDDLTVGAAGQRRRTAITGAGHLAEQLHPVGPGQHLPVGAGDPIGAESGADGDRPGRGVGHAREVGRPRITA